MGQQQIKLGGDLERQRVALDDLNLSAGKWFSPKSRSEVVLAQVLERPRDEVAPRTRTVCPGRRPRFWCSPAHAVAYTSGSATRSVQDSEVLTGTTLLAGTVTSSA